MTPNAPGRPTLAQAPGRRSSERRVRGALNLPPGYAFDYKDVHVLKYFLTAQGKIIPRHLSGLTAVEHRGLTQAVNRARHIALLPHGNHQQQ